MINVAILGYGTVGSGVFEVLNENKESISRRAGQELHVKYVLDLRDFPGQPVEKVLVHDYEQIVSDPEVDIVVEVMGGVEPAYTFVKKALLAGKNVCTSNKALVAKHGRELMDIAKEKREQAERQALEQEKQMQKTIIGIKKRFGKNAILKGMNFQEGATARERNEQVGGHKA